ncbi:MAG: inner membrane protein YpjD [Betaproteobacteria bacterium]|jgi:ABC-type uncharacterized transport system permease subunit|nr:inner membrane protein YpjD [Betaproteobacteria bacterium]
MTILLYGLPTLLYALALRQAWPRAFVTVAGARAATGVSPQPSGAMLPQRWIVLAALLIQGVSLVLPVAANDPHFGFAHVLSAAIWLALGILWLESIAVPMGALWLLVLPLAVAVAWLPGVFPGSPISLPDAPLFVPHLLLGVCAYSFMTLAALQSILMAMAERALQAPARFGFLAGGQMAGTSAGTSAGASAAASAGTSSGPSAGSSSTTEGAWGAWIDALPPLLTLERLLFRLISAGFVFLSLTVLTGIVFSESAFGRPFRLDHKTVFTLLAWSLFATLLIGRRLHGWRGRTALRFTLGGFTLLMFAYAGSRFVFEVILSRGPT